jgi:hypothetical protein
MELEYTEIKERVHGELECERPPNEVYLCDYCLRFICWCSGGTDFDGCDDCWVRLGKGND